MEVSMNRAVPDAAWTTAHAGYALQACAFFAGGIPLLVALIVGYLKRPDVRGTWLESHFTWQIRTFWASLLWLAVSIVAVFFLVGYLILGL